MYFKLPSNMKYVDLAIYIDAHVRDKENRDEQKLFEYMWHLFYILAVKGKYFTNGKDYDDYALYGATQLFLRYQRELDGANVKPIKSSLNYIKSILYPMRVDYQKANFNEIFQEESLGGESPDKIKELAYSSAKSTSNQFLSIEYREYFKKIHHIVDNYLKKTPYSSQPRVLHNLYLSCILTILKTITLSNKNKARVQNKLDRVLPTATLIDQIYKDEFYDNVVVWHLDKSMRNYVMTLVARIKKLMAKDLRYIIGSFEPTEEVMKAILSSPLKDVQSIEIEKD